MNDKLVVRRFDLSLAVASRAEFGFLVSRCLHDFKGIAWGVMPPLLVGDVSVGFSVIDPAGHAFCFWSSLWLGLLNGDLMKFTSRF